LAKRIEVRFEVEVPADMPLDAAEEWIAFECHARAEMEVRHPQMERDIEPVPGTFRTYPKPW
jgi:muconolactone delta-isomerase